MEPTFRHSKMLLLVIPLGVSFFGLSSSQPCASRDYGNGGTVCVCNLTYCDSVPTPEIVPSPQFLAYTSNKAGLRFQQSNGTFRTLNLENGVRVNNIYVDSTTRYQTMIGWGGAFTDATGININSLPPNLQETLLRSLFGPNGIEYSLGRVPIGGTDFSLRAYSYDDGPEDPQLNNFNLTSADFNYKIPIIRRATNLSNGKLRLFCSAWTAPRWMKTNNEYAGYGFIRRSMYQTWANYYLKFLQAYQQQNVSFWGMTTGNEPADVLNPFDELEVVGWPYWTLREWIAENLGPTIRQSNFSNIHIMVLDDQRIFLPWYVERVLASNETRQYINGIAVHWYLDDYIPASVLSNTQQLFPEMFILGSEASNMPEGDAGAVVLGSWSRGVKYSVDIIQDVQNWVTGWVDWNMALNAQGGPNYIRNFVDAAIIVNATSSEFYKQPMYYHLGHFSKFVPPQSVRISSSGRRVNGVDYVAFRRPDNGTAVVLLNSNAQNVRININDISRGTAPLELSGNSITTVLYW